MNFIDDRELAARFATDMVPSRERVAYLAATTGLNYLAFTFLTMDPPDYQPAVNRYDIAGEIGCFAIVMATLMLAYRVNRMGDDQDFIARYICLSFPILVRTLALGFALILGFVLILENDIAVEPSPPEIAAGGIEELVIVALPYAYMAWRTATAFRIASGAENVFART